MSIAVNHEKKLKQVLQERRDEILEIALKHGAFNVRVFGSVARSEETENSDVDFLINYDINKISSWFPVGLIHDLEDLLGRKVDVVTETGLKERIRDRVLRDCILL
ncbi:nucleotidyltransferase family protein [Pseudanabaena sp. FACHB-1277]|jgi:predicted nucleotidyltransferase|uniref:Nucleotidyltransferase family protein n=1 Tax=Pseudanabaena cinerea FACHB-1277 TaxID=2949581 RepID=A0A926UPU0_9CYAN|nr:nucleotidyltransferase family protein [Pseudanabaena cinerea]MBD2148787.1 nucleotidyltransferase family protein [Pseudanabaena cinerea FACHB-1277]